MFTISALSDRVDDLVISCITQPKKSVKFFIMHNNNFIVIKKKQISLEIVAIQLVISYI